MTKETDTYAVVVGAGISGLAAARTLVRSGLRVVILEARDRVGGRLLSSSSPHGGLDLGATWFWPNEPRIGALVTDLAVATHAQHLAGDAVVHDHGSVHRIAGNPIDVSSSRVSAGMQEIATALGGTLPAQTIRLEHPVTTVRRHGTTILADTARGSFRGRHLILALPPALALATIEFEPGLNDATAAVARNTPVWMGGITKVVARFSSPFWRGRGLAGAAISHVGPMREIHDASGPDGSPAALFGFAPPTRIGQPTVEPEQVVDQLVTLFGPDAAEPVELIIHDWRTERFTSPPGAEGMQAYETYGHPCYGVPDWAGQLHWASTETSPDFPGHIEGALVAAARAARAVITSSTVIT